MAWGARGGRDKLCPQSEWIAQSDILTHLEGWKRDFWVQHDGNGRAFQVEETIYGKGQNVFREIYLPVTECAGHRVCMNVLERPPEARSCLA